MPVWTSKRLSDGNGRRKAERKVAGGPNAPGRLGHFAWRTCESTNRTPNNLSLVLIRLVLQCLAVALLQVWGGPVPPASSARFFLGASVGMLWHVRFGITVRIFGMPRWTRVEGLTSFDEGLFIRLLPVTRNFLRPSRPLLAFYTDPTS